TQHGVEWDRSSLPCLRRAVQGNDRGELGERALSRGAACAYCHARRTGPGLFRPHPSSIGYIRAGKVRPLAITSATRSKALPDLPTVSEFVPGYEASIWWGVGAPKATPAEIVDKLNKEINAALDDPKMKARLADLGGVALPGSPAEFGTLIADETEKWAKVINIAGIKPE